VLTMGGLVSFILGSYLLVGSNAPPGYEVAPAALWTLSGCFLVLSLFLAGAVLRARLRPPATGKSALLGQVGTVRSALQPSGMVFADGELWSAKPETDIATPIPVGTKVVIVGVDRLTLSVRPATEGDVVKADLKERSHQVGEAREVVPFGPAPAPDRQSIIP